MRVHADRSRDEIGELHPGRIRLLVGGTE